MSKTYMPPPVIGYRALSEEEVNLMNAIKAASNQIGNLVKTVQETEGVDLRWVQLGADSIQTGVMQVLRGITKPDSF